MNGPSGWNRTSVISAPNGVPAAARLHSVNWLRGRNLTVSPGYEPSVATFYYPALAIILILGGCATPTPAVKIPVAVSCIKEAPAKPATQDEAAILKMDDYAATVTAWTERLLLKSYAEKADALIQACR